MGRCREVWIIVVVLELLSGTVDAQVWDDFNDGDFVQGTHWVGDTGQFIVDNGELRLFSSGSDSSCLVTAFQSGLDTVEWRFRLRMPFAPSSQNFVRFYLWSDSPDLESTLSGYYLQFGETGSGDAFELRYQNGWTSSVLLRGPDSLIANGAAIRMKVVRFPGGFWQLDYDPTGGDQFLSSGTAFHPALPSAAFLGWKCVYTSSNAQKCYLDDVYAGFYQLDLTPPELSDIQLIGLSALGLTWNEPVEVTSALDKTRYSLIPLGEPDSVVTSAPDGRSFVLHFPGAILDTVVYLLEIHAVSDESGNLIADTLKTPVFRVFAVEPGEVVFSEIMANPAGAPLLPQHEYVELYNRSQRVLSLAGCSLHDATSTCAMPDDTLKPGEHIVYASTAAAEAFAWAGFTRCTGISCFPSLNNDGDSLRITGSSGSLIDAIDYDNTMYVDPLRDDQGWSLERLDVRSACSSRENWKASADHRGGTPGQTNSVYRLFTDTIAPRPEHAYPLSGITTLLYFSEWPDTVAAKDPNLYRLEPGGWMPAEVRIGTGRPHVQIDWPQSFAPGTIYQLVIGSQLSDCSGNRIDTTDAIELGLPVPVNSGDVIINEVLFNPIGDDGDFVEVFNRSSQPLDLAQLRFAYADPEDGIVKNAVGLQTGNRLLMPGGYMVAAVSPDMVATRYPINGKTNLIRAELSGYDDDEGIVVLLDASLRELDKFYYTDDLHHPLLADPEGVSLERIRTQDVTDEKQNWHSASFQAGFATPGLRNSQQPDSFAETADWFELQPRLFSPDNDGYRDVLQMVVHLDKPGYMASVNIYDENGWVVRHLTGNEYLGPDAGWTWNGTNDDGELLPAGPYIIAARFLHIDGGILRVRKACVIAPGRMQQ